MKLVIAEKPMLARDIARAICGGAVTETTKLPISGNGYTVVACAGHLLQFAMPDDIKSEWGAPWNLTVLPIKISSAWPKTAVKGKESLLKEIKSLISSCNSVINAGDPDDEGQLIVDEVLDYLGYKGKVERVYVNDSIDKNIRKAFNDLKDNEECRPQGNAAFARSIADYSFGINESRLATLKCGRKVSVGRVQTPTLGLVVKRDLAIKNHVREKYYTLVTNVHVQDQGEYIFSFKPSKEFLEDEKYITSLETTENIKEKTGPGIYIKTEIKPELKQPPLPYNLTVLISDMSSKYGYTAKQVQDTTQNLRDKYKAITYNRTDCQYLKEEHYAEAPAVLGIALKNIGKNYDLDYSIHSKAFNDANITAHHGIIPQEITVDVSCMSEIEKRIYVAIVKRYAMQFMKARRSDISISTFSIAEGVYEHRSRKLIDPGYEIIEKEADEDESLQEGFIDKGEYEGVVKDITIEEKETAPPKPYTEGSLIKDMASISKYVKDPEIKAILKKKDSGKKGENGGIGTTATRSVIIETLKKRGFIEEKKGKIRATALGIEFYNLLPPEIRSADTTAKWWLLQEDIAEGNASVDAIQESVIEIFNDHKDTAYSGADLSVKKDVKVIGKCPVCGQAVIDIDNKKLNAYKCENKSCGFILWKTQYGSKLTAANAAKILLSGKTGVMSFKSKSGKLYRAKLKLNPDKKSLSLEFINKK